MVRRRSPLERAVRALLVALALAWSALPIALVVLSSFKEASQIFEVPPALVFRPTLDNYRALWNERPEFFRALRSSLIVTMGTTLLTIVASTLAGYVYARYRNRLLSGTAFGMLAARMLPPIIITVPLFPILNALRMNDPDRLGDWFGRFVTLYRNAGEVLAAPEPRSRIEVEWDLQQGGGLQRHPWSRMAWRKSGKQARLYVNGQDHTLPVRDAKCVANSGELDGPAYAALSQAGRDCVFELLQAGHYRLAGADDDHDGDGDEEQA